MTQGLVQDLIPKTERYFEIQTKILSTNIICIICTNPSDNAHKNEFVLLLIF